MSLGISLMLGSVTKRKMDIQYFYRFFFFFYYIYLFFFSLSFIACMIYEMREKNECVLVIETFVIYLS